MNSLTSTRCSHSAAMSFSMFRQTTISAADRFPPPSKAG
jgi:hypothetical protein